MLAGEFPTRENCDPNVPEEAFLWAFAALPGVKGAPLLMPVAYYRLVSKHLWELGFRQSEEPIKEWVPPQASDANWITSPGKWVPIGTAPKVSEEDVARREVGKMTQQQRHELLTVLEAGTPYPETPAGKVADSLSLHQRQIVLSVLRQA